MKKLSANISKHSLFENIIPGVYLSVVLTFLVTLPILSYTSSALLKSLYLLGSIVIPAIIIPLIYYISSKITNTNGRNNLVDRENLWTVFFISWFKIIGLIFLVSFITVFAKIIFSSIFVWMQDVNFSVFVFGILLLSVLFTFFKRKLKSSLFVFILFLMGLMVVTHFLVPVSNNDILSGYFEFLTQSRIEPITWLSLILWGSIIGLHRSFNINTDDKVKFIGLQSLSVFFPFLLILISIYLFSSSVNLTFESILSSYYGNGYLSLIVLLILPVISSISILIDEFQSTLKELFPGKFQKNRRFILPTVAFILSYFVSIAFSVSIIAEIAIVIALFIFIIWNLYALLVRKNDNLVHPMWIVLSLVFSFGLLFSVPFITVLFVFIFALFGQLIYGRVKSFFISFNRSIELVGDVDWVPEPNSVLLYLHNIENLNRSFRVAKSLVSKDVHIRVLLVFDETVSKSKKLKDISYIRKALSKYNDDKFSVVAKLSDDLIIGIRELLVEEEHETLLLQYNDSEDDRDFIKKILVNIPSKVLAWSYDISKVNNALVQVFGSSGEECIKSIIPLMILNKGSIFAINSVEVNDNKEIFQAASNYLKSALSIVPDSIKLSQKTFRTDDINYTTEKLIKDYDLYVLSVNTDLISDDVDFLEFGYPTLLVKKPEFNTSQLLRKMWLYFYELIPNLSSIQQRLISVQMQKDAVANTDFYIMILLSSGIAYFGLLQNSAAVIIGGMLVAPLLVPMMAVAHSVIQGNSLMLKQAITSTLKGVGVIIFISFTLTVLVGLNVDPTNEILARTTPNILDLFVALISGGAAAYAISRKTVSAALPGVAISAALVPPLCVLGYGLGIVNGSIIVGSFLLFGTNLVAIVMSSMLVFLLLGFRPYQFENQKAIF